jgi:hypothetical protein
MVPEIKRLELEATPPSACEIWNMLNSLVLKECLRRNLDPATQRWGWSNSKRPWILLCQHLILMGTVAVMLSVINYNTGAVRVIWQILRCPRGSLQPASSSRLPNGWEPLKPHYSSGLSCLFTPGQQWHISRYAVAVSSAPFSFELRGQLLFCEFLKMNSETEAVCRFIKLNEWASECAFEWSRVWGRLWSWACVWVSINERVFEWVFKSTSKCL